MEDKSQTEREEKQRYLFDQIIEGGYDPSNFEKYLNSLKPEGCAFTNSIFSHD